MVRSIVLCVVTCGLVATVGAGSGGSSSLLTELDQIHVVPAGGGTIRRLTSGSDAAFAPSWSPDGRRLAFARERAVAIVDRAGRELAQLRARVLAGPDPPSWSPDGRRLAFTSLTSPEGTARIVVARLGGARRVVASTPWGTADKGRGPVWSPDGKQLAFCLQGKPMADGGIMRSGDLDLAVAPPEGSPIRVSRAAGNELAPEWSPDSRRIVYVSTPSGGTGASFRLLTAVGSGSRLVVRLRTAWGASWSPDGKLIAFAGNTHGDPRTRLYVVRPDGTGLRRLTGEITPDRPVWSPDGRRIAFGTYEPGIDVIAPDGSRRTTIASMDGAEIRGLAWSPDGKTVAFAARKAPASD